MKPWVLVLSGFLLANLSPSHAADVVVYGGTPGGIIAAVAASREGASVVLIEPSPWIGGVVAGGLSKTDTGRPDTIGGYTLEFFKKASARYNGDFMWFSEPHINMETFETMLKEAKVTVIRGQGLKSVSKTGSRIASITTQDGRTHEGKQFIDATYEGDLMAKAGVSYIVGRESRDRYLEPIAGYYPMPIRPRTVAVMESDCPSIGGVGPSYIHGTPALISGVDDKGKPIFGVYPAPRLNPGDADGMTQSYTYRVCVTQRADIKVPFPKPSRYEPERYELLLRLIKKFPGIRFGRLFYLGDLANGKFDLNSQGLDSTDYPGANTEYPDGNEATRERIKQDHIDYVQGMFWFLSHDERVPQSLRDQASSWGLCKDEFADNKNWPYALYVREARRMIGEYVVTQKDLQEQITKPDCVALGSFLIDSHIVQRILAEDGTIRDEGAFADVPVRPYEIPYRALLPKRAQCENLLVPVCLSASHIAYCSIRMEPVYMALGHASGVAAVLAMHGKTSVQGVDVATLQSKLLSQKAVLKRISNPAPKLDGIVVDDEKANYKGEWKDGDFGNPLFDSAHHDNNEAKGEKQAVFEIKVPADGRYEVRFAYATAPNRADNAPLTIKHASGTTEAHVNEKLAPALDGHFVSLGTFDFKAEFPAIVTIGNAGTNGYVSVDAVQLLPVGSK